MNINFKNVVLHLMSRLLYYILSQNTVYVICQVSADYCGFILPWKLVNLLCVQTVYEQITIIFIFFSASNTVIYHFFVSADHFDFILTQYVQLLAYSNFS